MKTNKKTERSSSPNCLPAKRDLEKDETGGSSVQRLVRQFFGWIKGKLLKLIALDEESIRVKRGQTVGYGVFQYRRDGRR